MVDVTKIDHVQEGLSLLPSTWDNTPVIRGVLEAWLTPLNQTEQDALDVRDGFNVRSAIGYQLDIIGAYFNESRKGRTDNEYRSAILAIIASSNGSGTPDQLMDLFASLTSTSKVDYWEHYPLSVAMLAADGDDVNISDIDNMLVASPAGVEYAALIYDPNKYAWKGNEATSVLANVYANGDNVITDLSDNVVAEVVVEDVDNGDFRSSFVDISVDDPSSFGWGQNYGANYGGSPSGFSQFAEASILGNPLTVNGGNGFLPWAEQSEYDPITGTTNKAKPIKQIQDTGLKRGQPLPRQFFNWMIGQIDSWFNLINNRAAVGSVKMTVDPVADVLDFAGRFGGTWTYIGEQTWTTNNITSYAFKRIA